MSTSPLERSILSHYHCFAGPWKDGSENWTKLDRDIVNKYLEIGLLRQEARPDSICMRVVGNHEALAAYMEALGNVPLPVQRWVVPSAVSPQ